MMKNATKIIPLSPSLENTPEDNTGIIHDPGLTARVLPLSLQAILNAMIIGIVAKGLVLLIELITNLAFYQRFSFRPATPAGNTLGWLVVLIPIIGSLLVGVMARFGSAAIRGHGIPEAMEKIIMNQSKIPPRLTFLKPLSAAISIGTGGPFGAEGPIIATGGAFGSLTGQIMRISAQERKIMLTAGACAGMATIFGSPLAAVMLAIELLLFEFSPRSIIPVALSCTTGAAMHLFLFGSHHVFEMLPVAEPSGVSLVTYVIMGLVIGVAASGVSKSVYWVEDLFEKLPIHWMWWPAIGAIAVGITGYFAPATMGVGYENITGLLTGSLGITTLLVLCFLKYISWVLSLGSGTSGGTLAPLFTIGGAFGALLGILIQRFFPSVQINLPTAALIGMAAMFTGASRAILTSIVFALETTGNVHGLLPLLGACTAAYLVSFFLIKGSIMTEKIQRRGVRTPQSFEPDVLRTIGAEELVKKVSILVSADTTVGDLRTWSASHISRRTDDLFIVADEDETFVGYVERKKVFNKQIAEEVTVRQILSPKEFFVTENLHAGAVAEIMGNGKMDVIAVLDNAADGRIIGMISTADIVNVYSAKRLHETKFERSLSIRRRTLRFIIKGRTSIRARSTRD
jgi:CIC family chloride channel protein